MSVPFIILSLHIEIFSFAYSLEFSEQHVVDKSNDWINMKTKQIVSEFRIPDITSVDYFIDKNFLNATVWLFKPFKEPSKSLFKEVDYGMFIDSDFNTKTGFGGIDYKIEIGWDNDTNTWTKRVVKWGLYDTNQQVIDLQPNFTEFYKNGENYIKLSLDLNKILNPNKYKVIFYADSRKTNEDLIIDYTRWVAIPQLELISYTNPSSIELTQGETKTLEVKLNSTEGYEPLVHLSAKAQDKNIIASFDFSNITVPSYGIGTTPLRIYADKDAKLGPSTLFIFADSNFPSEELVKVMGTQPVSPDNVLSRSSVSLFVNPAPDWLEQLHNVWSKVGDFSTFIYGIMVGVSPFIYTRLKKYFSK